MNSVAECIVFAAGGACGFVFGLLASMLGGGRAERVYRTAEAAAADHFLSPMLCRCEHWASQHAQNGECLAPRALLQAGPLRCECRRFTATPPDVAPVRK